MEYRGYLITSIPRCCIEATHCLLNFATSRQEPRPAWLVAMHALRGKSRLPFSPSRVNILARFAFNKNSTDRGNVKMMGNCWWLSANKTA